MIRLLVLALLPLAPPAAAQSSAAARYLVDEQIAVGCPAGGHMRPEGVIERDLDGDGRQDLILWHGGVSCDGASALSGVCGAAQCRALIYLRRGDLLARVEEARVARIDVGAGSPPPITLIDGRGQALTVRWDGSQFR